MTLMRLAGWRAGRSGLDDVLLHPADLRPRAAADVVAALVQHVRPALEASGDTAIVDELLTDLLGRGTGARRQRAVLSRGGGLADVVLDAVRVTES